MGLAMKILLWIVGIIFLIGLLVVVGAGKARKTPGPPGWSSGSNT